MENGAGQKRDWVETMLDLATSRSLFLLLVAIALVVGLIPVFASVFLPASNNSLVLTVCAAVQSLVSIFAGIVWSKDEAVKEANMKWVPMAASACDRLAAILGAVSNLRTNVSDACSAAARNLPELKNDTNRAVKVHFEGFCSSNATRLGDIQDHLDSALTDWERFIKQNCSGSECADIGRRLDLLKSKLIAENSRSAQIGCTAGPPEGAALPSPDPGSQPAPIELMVTGVTTENGCNGRWILQEISKGYWRCDLYILRKTEWGWYVEEETNTENYFFKPGGESEGGLYERCAVCPHDGRAVVFNPVKPFKATLAMEMPRDTDSTLAQSPSSVSIPTNAVDITPISGNSTSDIFLKLGISNNEYMQHAMVVHGLELKTIVTALRESSNLAEYSAMLGINCPDVVSPCALPGINVFREMLNRPALQVDEKLHQHMSELARAPLAQTNSDTSTRIATATHPANDEPSGGGSADGDPQSVTRPPPSQSLG